jgi:hypothetical protein
MGLGVEKDKSMTTEKFILPPEAVIAYVNVLLLAELVVQNRVANEPCRPSRSCMTDFDSLHGLTVLPPTVYGLNYTPKVPSKVYTPSKSVYTAV